MIHADTLTLFPLNFLHLLVSFSGNKCSSNLGSSSSIIPLHDVTVSNSMRSLSNE